MTIAFLFVALFALMFIGVPIAISLGLAGSLTIIFFSPDSVRSLAIKLFETSEHYTLLAIPFFLLAGAFMTTGGVARRLIDFANACVGHIRGGLAIAAVLACMLFAALSGSSPATGCSCRARAARRSPGSSPTRPRSSCRWRAAPTSWWTTARPSGGRTPSWRTSRPPAVAAAA